MSKDEATDLIKEWLQHKMLWFDDSSFSSKYLVNQAINVIGPDEVDRIYKELKTNWQDE